MRLVHFCQVLDFRWQSICTEEERWGVISFSTYKQDRTGAKAHVLRGCRLGVWIAVAFGAAVTIQIGECYPIVQDTELISEANISESYNNSDKQTLHRRKDKESVCNSNLTAIKEAWPSFRLVGVEKKRSLGTRMSLLFQFFSRWSFMV